MATQVKTGLIANDAITDAKIANVALTGVTASGGDSSTALATTAFVATEINSLIDSAPGALNTLNELAAAMGDDANFSTTVTNSIAAKLPLAGGTLTGALVAPQLTVDNVGINGDTITLTGTSASGFIQTSSNVLQIGTSTDDKIDFYTNNTLAATLLGNGKFGIGNPSPNRQLSLKHASQAEIGFKTGSVSNGALIYYNDSENQLLLRTQESSDNIAFQTGGTTERMRITSGGNVGIGTNNPSKKLSIFNSNPSWNQYSTLRLATETEGTYYGDISFHRGTSDDTDRGFVFNLGGTERMRILHANGNVGIGTDTPGEALEVDGVIQIKRTGDHPAMRFMEGGTTRAYMGSGDWAINGGAVDDFGISSSSTGDLLLGVNAGNEKFRIKAGNGHVGIGTNNPRYNLTVEGNNTTAVGIGVDNISGSSTLDIAALGTGYNNHQAGAGEVWFFSPDNINIGGATGHTNDVKFLANNSVNMIVKGATGKVGIGTQAPLKKLHIVGGGYDQIMINSSSGNNTNRLSGISGINYTGNQFSFFQNFSQNGSTVTYYGSADGAFKGINSHKFYVAPTIDSSTTTLGLDIASTGQVRMPKTAAFESRGSSGSWVTLSSGGWQDIGWVELNDANGNLSGVTYSGVNTVRFTAPHAGYYSFNLNYYLRWNAAAAQAYVHPAIFINGAYSWANTVSPYSIFGNAAAVKGNSDGYPKYAEGVTISRIIYMASGDYAEPKLYTNGSSWQNYANYNYFAGGYLSG